MSIAEASYGVLARCQGRSDPNRRDSTRRSVSRSAYVKEHEGPDVETILKDKRVRQQLTVVELHNKRLNYVLFLFAQ